MSSLLERTVPWPPDKSWSISGPNSGGGHTVFLSQGRLFHYFYGDEAQCAEGEAVQEQSLADFVAAGRFPQVLAELLARGLLAG